MAETAERSDKPPVSTVQRFLHLLDDSDKDFDEELGPRSAQAFSRRRPANGTREASAQTLCDGRATAVRRPRGGCADGGTERTHRA